MTCEHCKKAVEEVLRAIEGVSAVQVSLSERSARVEGSADPSLLVAAVIEEGFQASLA